MAEVRGFCVELIDLGVTLVKPSTFPGWRHPWLKYFWVVFAGLRRAAWPNVFCYKLNIYVYVVIATVAVLRFCLQLCDAFFFRSGPTIHIEILLFIQGTNVSCQIVIPGNHGRFFQDMSWQLPCQFCGTGKILKELPQMSGRIVSLACIESMSEDRGPRAREYQLFKENYRTSRCGIFRHVNFWNDFENMLWWEPKAFWQTQESFFELQVNPMLLPRMISQFKFVNLSRMAST